MQFPTVIEIVENKIENKICQECQFIKGLQKF